MIINEISKNYDWSLDKSILRQLQYVYHSFIKLLYVIIQNHNLLQYANELFVNDYQTKGFDCQYGLDKFFSLLCVLHDW